MSVRIHTIGDGAIHVGLGAYENEGVLPGVQNTLEHLENIQRADIKRLAELKVIASMQPVHAVADPSGVERDLGPERTPLMWAFRDMLDSGVTLAFGTDVPCAPLNPFEAIYYAVTRKSLEGLPEGGWEGHQAITVNEALRAYTLGSAMACRRQDEMGSLEAGKLADVAVLDRDMFAADPSELKDVRALLTVLDGKIVLER
jgi:predicted amidohydrolase YtcJ